MKTDSKKLQELLDQQRELRSALERSEKATKNLKMELALSGFEALLESLTKFANLFNQGGPGFKAYKAVNDNLKTLKGYDPEYAHKLGTKEPYGVKISDPVLKYCVTDLLGGVWNTEPNLAKILERMVNQKTRPGNPLKEGD